MKPAQSIPVVDLASFRGGAAARTAFVENVGRALTEIGFVAVEGHGISPDLVARAYGIAERFFSLDDSAKRRYEDFALKGQRGFTSFGREHAKDSPAPDLKEYWHVGREMEPEHPMWDTYPHNLWPGEIPDFRPAFLALYDGLERCAMALLQACAIYIGEDPDRFTSIATNGNTILRIIHYPPVPPDADPASVRAAAHEDINLITLLCEATAPGLELLERDGSWRPIHALKGQIIVDSGDMLQNITNGLYRSTTHRVTNPANVRDRRFSMPFFVHPRSEASLDPLPSCVARMGGDVRYPPITAGEYLEQRLREIGLGGKKY